MATPGHPKVRGAGKRARIKSGRRQKFQFHRRPRRIEKRSVELLLGERSPLSAYEKERLALDIKSGRIRVRQKITFGVHRGTVRG